MVALGRRRRFLPGLVVVVAAVAMLTGCAGGGATPLVEVGGSSKGPEPSDAPAASSDTPTTEPSHVAKSQREIEIEAATASVVAYRQRLAEIYSEKHPPVAADITRWVTAARAERDAASVRNSMEEGYRNEPGAVVTLVHGKAVEVDLKNAPNTLVLRLCIDLTDVTTIEPGGESKHGIRQMLDYSMVRVGEGTAGWRIDTADLVPGRGRKC